METEECWCEGMLVRELVDLQQRDLMLGLDLTSKYLVKMLPELKRLNFSVTQQI